MIDMHSLSDHAKRCDQSQGRGVDQNGQPKPAGLIGIGGGAKMSITAQIPAEIRRLVPATANLYNSSSTLAVEPSAAAPSLQLFADSDGTQFVVTGFSMAVSFSCCSATK